MKHKKHVNNAWLVISAQKILAFIIVFILSITWHIKEMLILLLVCSGTISKFLSLSEPVFPSVKRCYNSSSVEMI